MITKNELYRFSPRMASYYDKLVPAMSEFEIDSKERQAAFLAQIAHESAKLRYWEEIASGAAYEGRKDLGNTHPGDGMRYKGRGPIQLTGRANYVKASAHFGIDFVSNPETVAHPDYGLRIAGWFWDTHGLNPLADTGNFDRITRIINGGYNGLAEREAYWRRAKLALGVA